VRVESGAGRFALRLVVPSFWLGLLVALAFIETPLKFLGPGVTLDIALGIGRLVLTAADIAGAGLLLATTVLVLLRPRVGKPSLWVLGGLWLVLVVQVGVVRPLLNARTEAVLAGLEAGGSWLHNVYIVADVLLVGLLIALLVTTVREYRAAIRR